MADGRGDAEGRQQGPITLSLVNRRLEEHGNDITRFRRPRTPSFSLSLAVLPASAVGARIGYARVSTKGQLLRVEPPLARPPILTDVRVSTQMLMGIAAIAAFASEPGLGNQIFRGISSQGSANTLDEVLSGTLGIVVPALPFDAGYVLIGRLTISRGIRG